MAEGGSGFLLGDEIIDEEEQEALLALFAGRHSMEVAASAGSGRMEETCPNIHDLFMHYNKTYFEDRLGFCR